MLHVGLAPSPPEASGRVHVPLSAELCHGPRPRQAGKAARDLPSSGALCHGAKGAALGEANVTINMYKGSSVGLLEGSLLLEKSQIELK